MEDCKKIVAFLPSTTLYGKERSNIEVFRLIQQTKGLSLKIVCEKEMSPQLASALSGLNIELCKFPKRSRGRWRYVRYLIDVIRINLKVYRILKKENPEVLYLNNEMSVYDLFPLLYFWRAKIIYRIGDIPAFPSLSGYLLNSRMWHEIVVKKVSTVVSISNFIRNEVKKTGRNNINDKVIYNYPPKRDTTMLYSSPANDTDILTLGYLGQIRELKGIHVLVDAVIEFFRRGKKVQLVIAGDTTLFPEYMAEISKKIKDANCEALFQFKGEVEDISSFFNEIDILCIPTIWPEALGNVLVESKTYHTPVIIFPSGGMPELVSHKTDGYICERKDKESLINGFDFYYDNMKLIKEHGENAYNSLTALQIVRPEFEKQWLELFYSV